MTALGLILLAILVGSLWFVGAVTETEQALDWNERDEQEREFRA
jgi:hypothetical protein